MNTQLYPWLDNLDSAAGGSAISSLRERYVAHGAVTLPAFLTPDAVELATQQARAAADAAFTTDDTHTAYLNNETRADLPAHSVYHYRMRTQVASIAYDELPDPSPLKDLYHDPRLLQLVQRVVQQSEDTTPLYLSADPLGCCSINVFRPGMHHSFHFDESRFSVTLMLQQPSDSASGLFQYTSRLRQNALDLALPAVAATIQNYDDHCNVALDEAVRTNATQAPALHTLDYKPGTLFIFCGSCLLHRVTLVRGEQDRLTAVLTFADTFNFCNTSVVQKLFWGRTS